MKQLPKNYDHQARESFWQQHWVDTTVHHFKDDLPRDQTFVLDTPPPTVSGVLHMGHIFSYTQADFVARYQRMSGKDVFYPMGFDDNGLPTERLVEKIKGVRGSAMPRADFVALCREVVKEAEDEFRRLFKSAALSVDWRQEYQTISDQSRQLSQASFVDLLKKNEAYRDFRPTYWDWVDQTAIAQAETEEKELQGVQITIPFGIMDATQWSNSFPRPDFKSLTQVHVMTTRPELLGACVALMCHPDDKDQFTGKVAVSPLFNVVLPICFDEKVDKEKGTGFVMCCSWGDDTDKEWIAKYNLAWRPLIGLDGRLRVENQEGGIAFRAGRDGESGKATSPLTSANCFDITKAKEIFALIEGAKLIRDIKNENSAKGRVIRLLEGASLLVPTGDKLETVIPKLQMVKCAERSGTPIEIIPTFQWFIRIVDKKEQLLAKGVECTWYPEYMRIRLNQWIEGLKEDWCISRQRFFGVPFPVWYLRKVGDSDPNNWQAVSANFAQLPVDPTIDLPKGIIPIEGNVNFGDIAGRACVAIEDVYNIKGELAFKGDNQSHIDVIADIDVLDTWATSSISPQLNSRGICKDFAVDPKRHAKLFPADLRPQAHEIIRTWAFYTIVKAHLHQNTIPWKNVMISGWCLAADKSKMSKSKGNVITPVALIEEKGSDAVRYWASTSRLGTDTAFSEDLLKIGRKLVTKLWNATAFAAINLDKMTGKPTTAQQDFVSGIISQPLDLWVLSRLKRCISIATKNFESFEYCDARVAIEDFFWNDFCDNYLELVKARAYGETKGDQQSALYTIYHCLETLLRLFAPFVPHITEELYSHIFDDRYELAGSVHARGTWPRETDYPYDATAELAGMAAVDVLNVIRKVKSESNVSIKTPVRMVEVSAKGKEATWTHLKSILEDLKAAGTADNVTEVPAGSLDHTTDRGWFDVRVILTKIEEHKRNADQADHQKLEGKVVHGPGAPDLSKHVVKVQLNDLKESLTRQK